MTEERSPWARPPTGSDDSVGRSVCPAPVTKAEVPAQHSYQDVEAGYRAGTVTRLAPPPPPVPAGAPDTPDDLAQRNRLMLRWFGGGALAVLVIGLVVVLAMTMTGAWGGDGLLTDRAKGPTDTRPQLAKLCPPPPNSDPGAGADAPPPPPGSRTTDERSGISYQAYGEPWQPWTEVWTKGTLRVSYRAGQHFVTEHYSTYGGLSTYHATILSGAVPAAVNDGLALDLKCTGQQVAADVRAGYYPQPNKMELMRDEQTLLGGRPAWVTKFRLHFTEPGLTAKDELAAVALIDVGRPEAAILYVSVPGTHRQFDWVVDDVLQSVRPV